MLSIHALALLHSQWWILAWARRIFCTCRRSDFITNDRLELSFGVLGDLFGGLRIDPLTGGQWSRHVWQYWLMNPCIVSVRSSWCRSRPRSWSGMTARADGFPWRRAEWAGSACANSPCIQPTWRKLTALACKLTYAMSITSSALRLSSKRWVRQVEAESLDLTYFVSGCAKLYTQQEYSVHESHSNVPSLENWWEAIWANIPELCRRASVWQRSEASGGRSLGRYVVLAHYLWSGRALSWDA